MALRIPCPTCGDRSVFEFRYGGELPAVPDTVTDPDARDLDRGWMRANACGVVTERWFHEGGCRRWLTLVRDTAEDRVVRLEEPAGRDGGDPPTRPGDGRGLTSASA